MFWVLKRTVPTRYILLRNKKIICLLLDFQLRRVLRFHLRVHIALHPFWFKTLEHPSNFIIGIELNENLLEF